MASSAMHRRSHSSVHIPSSPDASPKSTPRRRPLHERSKSQTNALPERRQGKVYLDTPFPILSSQIFPPTSGPYIFEDADATDAGSTFTSTSKRPATPYTTSAMSEKENTPAPATPPVPEIAPLQIRRPATPDSKRKSRPTFEDIFGPGIASVNNSTQKSILRKQAPAQPPTKAITPTATVPTPARRRRSPSRPRSNASRMSKSVSPTRFRGLSSTESFALRARLREQQSREAIPKSSQSVSPLRSPAQSPTRATRTLDELPQNKTLNRVRSQSTIGSVKSRSSLGADYATTKPSQKRRRSSSSPEAPTEAFIETLINDVVSIQYPAIRQPSMNSLRSTTSFARQNYPAPLRLRRKRAQSHLSPVTPEISDFSAAEAQRQRPRSRTSVMSRSTIGTCGELSTAQPVIMSSFHNASGNWADEVGDVVRELDERPLWRSREDYLRTSYSDLRPGTSRSSASGAPGSFYQFLNDSSTAWANVYYKNYSQNRLDPPSPPLQRQPHSPLLKDDTPQQSTPNLHSSASPGSAGFPDTLYVRRLRPHSDQPAQFRHLSDSTMSTSSEWSAMLAETEDGQPLPSIHNVDATVRFVEASVIPSVPVSRQQNRAHSSSITALPSNAPVHRRALSKVDAAPRLQPDTRPLSRLARWSMPPPEAPEPISTTPFSPINRQILLFAIGFVIPFAWWLASLLPLPMPTRVRTPEMVEAGAGLPKVEMGSPHLASSAPPETRLDPALGNGVFDESELRTYRRAKWWRGVNRVMSFVGLCVIFAAVILVVVASR